MIVAVDTNVLVDVFQNDPKYAADSARALRQHIALGRLVVCEVVYSECVARTANARLPFLTRRAPTPARPPEAVPANAHSPLPARMLRLRWPAPPPWPRSDREP